MWITRCRQAACFFIALLSFTIIAHGQSSSISGRVTDETGKPLVAATVSMDGGKNTCYTDGEGNYTLGSISPGNWQLKISAAGYETTTVLVTVTAPSASKQNIVLRPHVAAMDEVVVTGTLKQVRKADSPVPVTIISSRMFQRNASSNIIDGLCMLNGLSARVNCNMCNTSDIGINGMPGPYSMVLIDGMPIVSSLSTVYGLSGIPNSIINRVEIVKGPASSLYGSEAIGGIINVLTKDPATTPKLFLDYNLSSWGELAANTGFSLRPGKKISSFFNADAYYFNTAHDQDNDGFLDKTLQRRISVFNKWNFKLKENRVANISLRYYRENRNGGEKGWDKATRGFVDFLFYNDDTASPDYNAATVLPTGYTIYNVDHAKGFRVPRFQDMAEQQRWLNQVRQANPTAALASNMKYQESIYTDRWEAVGSYELPIQTHITIQGSYNQHNQQSAYGTALFVARQRTGFLQAFWDEKFEKHAVLAGASFRYAWFSDNTVASVNGKHPFVTSLPGLFLQDMWNITDKTSILLGYRLDLDKTKTANGSHRNAVHSPRIAVKYSPDKDQVFRASVGTGYRVVNIFSEDHRALSGQYEARLGEQLQPERSISGTLNFEGKRATESIGLTYDISVYYTYFSNKIYPARNNATRTITYYNVNGNEYARNVGASVDIALNFRFPLRFTTGISYNQADLFELTRDAAGNVTGTKVHRTPFEFSSKWSGVYSAAYDIKPSWTVDITGEWRGPMLLPTQGIVAVYDSAGNKTGEETDPRSRYSPWFCKLNTQFTWKLNKNWQCYLGVKNMGNYVPRNLLVSIEDPFNDQPDPQRKGGLQFDTEYNYTAQQGRSFYLGLRCTL